MPAFSFVSRGAAVSGRLWRPDARGPHPLVLVAPGIGSRHDAPAVEALCAALAGAGLAAAVFDLPLQGRRASRKLSGRLREAAGGGAQSPLAARLWEAYRQQVAADLAAALAALLGAGDLDPRRLACLALEPGAEAASAWATGEPRIRLLRRGEPGALRAGVEPLAAALAEAA